MWSTESGHFVKVVKCHNEVNDDNRNEKRRNYTEDFKREAVALVTEQGYKISEAARSLDIGANSPFRIHAAASTSGLAAQPAHNRGGDG